MLLTLHVAVITLMQDRIQLSQDSVRAYVNYLKGICTQAGCDLQKHEKVFYDIAWAGLRNSPKDHVPNMTPPYCRFDTVNRFIDMAVASQVTHVEIKRSHQLQPQQQQQQKNQPTDPSATCTQQGYQ
jgi:hypothetical protein